MDGGYRLWSRGKGGRWMMWGLAVARNRVADGAFFFVSADGSCVSDCLSRKWVEFSLERSTCSRLAITNAMHGQCSGYSHESQRCIAVLLFLLWVARQGQRSDFN